MKNKFLKITLLMVFAFMLFVIPNVADAATYDIYTYTISGNEVTITGCDTSASGAIVIPSEIGGKKVTSIGDYAFRDCTSLTSITIPESVTSIGRAAFFGCTLLNSITGSDYVISVGGDAFYGTALYNDRSNWTDVVLCVGKCIIKADTSISGKYIIKSGTVSIGSSAFSGCTSLTSITIPESVTSIGGSAFYNCTSLTSITIPESVTGIGSNTFMDCTSLTSITIPDSVTSIGDSAFSRCSSLESITIPDSVTSIGSFVFNDCSRLASITIPDSVTSIGTSSFFGTALYNDRSNWTGGVLYIGNHIIRLDTSNFGEYTIKSGTVCIAGRAFDGCMSLTAITIPDSVTSIGSSAFSCCYQLTAITIPDSVTSIGSNAFDCCYRLTSITIPESVTSIGWGAFRRCTSLEEITLPFIGAKRGITGTFDSVFGYIFGHSPSSESGTTCQYYSDSGSAYYYIPSTLKKVTITDETVVPYGAFYNCVNLTDVTIKGNPTAIMAAAFMGHENLWNITIKSKNVRFANGQMFNVTDMPTIYGYEGSTTETYAKNYDLWFVALSEEDEEGYALNADGTLVNGKIVLDITTNKPVTDQALHVALYNDASKLVDYIIVPLNKEYCSFNVVFKDEDNSSFAKVFLWDGLESMTPVTQAKSVTIKR